MLDFNHVNTLQITSEQAEQRIDNFLLTKIKGVPKSLIYKKIRSGEIRINSGRIKPCYKLVENDRLRLPPIRVPVQAEKYVPKIESIQQSIIYEDKYYLVVNKPSGLAVHGGSGLNYGLIEILRKIRPDQDLELVHRLDRDTSGCVLIAKRRSALRVAHRLWRNGKVDKRYLLLVKGKCEDQFNVNLSLEKSHLKSGERMVVINPEGQHALTKFTKIERIGDYALLQATPITGRTHQIRVHAASSNLPICGDTKYGKQDCNKDLKQLGLDRLFLHAKYLGFDPAEIMGDSIVVNAPLDNELTNILKKLRDKYATKW